MGAANTDFQCCICTSARAIASRVATGTNTNGTPAESWFDGASMFADIVGFTEFNALQGDAEALRLLGLQEQWVLAELPTSKLGGLSEGAGGPFGDTTQLIA